MSIFINVIGTVGAFIFCFVSMIGAMITMYAAVSNRTDEIGTLRAIGFRRRSVIGAFLIEAALHSDAREARGLGGALRELEQKPNGDWLLAAVAAGFLAYATYLALLIVYRRISTSEDNQNDHSLPRAPPR